jgi:hypothetical protein
VIKSLGYQIYPGDVEAHICTLHEQVANCVVVGVAHEVVSEAPVAVVEKKHGAELSCHDLDRHARSLPSYMRPRHWIILEPDQMPLNRKRHFLAALFWGCSGFKLDLWLPCGHGGLGWRLERRLGKALLAVGGTGLRRRSGGSWS